MQFIQVDHFEQWRDHARKLLADGISPETVSWTQDRDQPSLFDSEEPKNSPPSGQAPPTVPKAFLDLASQVACHRDPQRWQILYRTVWRITHGERHLLKISTDDDIHSLFQMRKAVTRDVHKMKAFVRFRKTEGRSSPDKVSAENFVAWHRPDHRIVRLAAPFFARRFKGMNWTILTPDESVTWDQSELRYGPGVSASEAPDGDALEELWKTYYASIFNPARIKVAMMKREMPVRHWATLPEAELIPDLLHGAASRVEKMIESHEGFANTATHYMPEKISLPNLAKAATECRACDLCNEATQVVFGEGPATAKMVLIGEQPGDQEDVAGRPFVGPAGSILDHALAQAGIARDQVYVTNTVKHFKHTIQQTARGKRRLHQKPNSREIFACRPWLEAEFEVIQPRTIVCLGATPAQALFGRDFRMTKSRGEVIATEFCKQTLATWHPAAILRMPDDDRRRQMQEQLVQDLRKAVQQS